MNEENGSQNIIPVCKYNQTGYCQNGRLCNKTHSNTICQKRVCSDNNCIQRHPKTCKYFANNKSCAYKNKCAYAHHRGKSDVKLELLEHKVFMLKDEIKILAKVNEYINDKLRNIETDNDTMKKELSDLRNQVKVINATKSKMKELNKNTEFLCKSCDFRAETNNMLRKHINTKHPVAKVRKEECKIVVKVV